MTLPEKELKDCLKVMMNIKWDGKQRWIYLLKIIRLRRKYLQYCAENDIVVNISLMKSSKNSIENLLRELEPMITFYTVSDVNTARIIIDGHDPMYYLDITLLIKDVLSNHVFEYMLEKNYLFEVVHTGRERVPLGQTLLKIRIPIPEQYYQYLTEVEG